jgi:U4/U6.U5 tri-snRNP-associated protein 1
MLVCLPLLDLFLYWQQDFERQLAKERRRNQEIEEGKREAERLQDRGGWNVLLERENDQGSGDSMDIDRNEKGM